MTKIKKIEKNVFLQFCGKGPGVWGRGRMSAVRVDYWRRTMLYSVYTVGSPAAGSICHVAAGYCVHAGVKATVLSGGVSFNDSTTPSPTGVNPAEDAGDTSPNILVGGTSTGISPNIITYFRI